MPTVQFTQVVTDVDVEIYNQVKRVETGKAASTALSATDLAVHNDGANLPTIGVGLNLSSIDNIRGAVIGMTGVILSMCIGAVHADDGADVPNKRYEMWDTSETPTSNFQLCRELEKILNDPINAERESWVPGRMFKIPEGYLNFREIKWEPVPKEEWDDYIKEDYKDSNSFQRDRKLATKELGQEIFEKAYYNADHYGEKEWIFRFPKLTSWAKSLGIHWSGGKAKFEKNVVGAASPMNSPFYFKGRVFNFEGGNGSKLATTVSVREPSVYMSDYMRQKAEPVLRDREVCVFLDYKKTKKVTIAGWTRYIRTDERAEPIYDGNKLIGVNVIKEGEK